MTFAELLDRTAGAGNGLAADITFRSPYSEYRGRADVSHLFGLIDEVLAEVAISHRLEDGATAIAMFDARVEEASVEGSLLTVVDDADALAEVALLLRPFAGVKRALAQMGARLEERPLPSAILPGR